MTIEAQRTAGKQIKVVLEGKAASIVTDHGKIGFILFEKWFHKGDRTPAKWEIIGLGYAQDVMEAIFLRAASCEGGGVQRHANGTPLLPAGYVEDWLTKLHNTRLMPNTERILKFDAIVGSTIPTQYRDNVIKSLSQHRRTSELQAIETTGLAASLTKDFDLLREIYVDACVPPRCYFDYLDPLTLGKKLKGIGYNPIKGAIPNRVIPNQIAVLPNGGLKVTYLDGLTKIHESATEATMDFIRHYASIEIQFPGSFRIALAIFRKNCERAVRG